MSLPGGLKKAKRNPEQPSKENKVVERSTGKAAEKYKTKTWRKGNQRQLKFLTAPRALTQIRWGPFQKKENRVIKEKPIDLKRQKVEPYGRGKEDTTHNTRT